MRNIQFVAGIHGNEPVPVIALASTGVKLIVGNPEALTVGRRFLESDLNASFGKSGNSLEERRAKEILKKIPKKTVVVDLHTFSAVSDPFIVIVDLNQLEFAKTLGFKHVVYMKHNIKKGHALINYRNGVSVEVGNHTETESFERTVGLVKRIEGNNLKKGKVKIYEVYGIITEVGYYKNFALFRYKKDSVYPVLAGEKAYDFYGLKARILKET